MLLSVSLQGPGATDLGYLLHKHPDRVQRFSLPYGAAHVWYPHATEERCTAALMLDVDPVGLVRRGRQPNSFALAQYVNDRPYAASSFLSVAISTVFKSALNGRCDARPDLAEAPLALSAALPVVPARGGETVVRALLEPLGYEVQVATIPLDARHPEWGASRYLSLELSGTVRLSELLTHLYVLLPVLDDAKHYWVGDDEVEKLLERGRGWLATHPERELITRRYLKHQRRLVDPAVAHLEQTDGGEVPPDPADESAEEGLEDAVRLRDLRLDAVERAVRDSGARRVLDLGCGPGALLRRLLRAGLDELVGIDVSVSALERAARALHLDELPDAQRDRIKLLQGALTYRDRRMRGYDAAVLQEVIEHLDEPRLRAAEAAVFGYAQPSTVIVTTPNAEYNVRWPSLPAGQFRHADHRFEWTRAEFADWAGGVADQYGYADVQYLPIGPVDEQVGSPTQMAVFTR